MNSQQQLEHYLAATKARLRKLTLLKGAVAIAVVLLVFSLTGAWFSLESGFASNTTTVFRILLALALAAAVLRYLIDPLQNLDQHLSADIEERVPEFDGRIETYNQKKASGNPFIDLLAEDALKVSAQHQATSIVTRRELQLAGGSLGLLAVVFFYLLVAAPGLLDYSMRNLLAGWAIPDLLPPQSITVTPGDESVRRGANVRITSAMQGFSPDEATIHLQNDQGEWQEVAMVQSPLGFEFTFFSMQQNMRYYISTTGLRSPEFGINVVDVPGIESLELSYHYPDWTDRDDEIFTRGDINALPETRISLKLTTTSPLSEGVLILNSNSQKMNINGLDANAQFTIEDAGEYYLAAIVGGEEVRISDDYFIRLTEDGKPEIKIVRPGGDYNASSIEEVLVQVDANDDYGLDEVALQYSVNGSDFEKVVLAAKTRDVSANHLFMLEDMTTVATRAIETNVGQFEVRFDDPDAEPQAEPTADSLEAEEERIPLQPGDIISFYAEASDRSQTVRTDMFFIQVQPFNRRYSRSQLSGGGGGGGGGGPQDEISQRQRQIIVSAWNLVREQNEGESATQVDISAKLLSELQTTLAGQAATLAERTRARQLADDAQIEAFVNNMEQAVQHMYPASERLAEVDLNEAIKPAQEALQYLLRAESQFNDMQLTQQEGGGGGAGGRASQDLAEMFELEMDLSLNQYETGENVSAQSQQQEADDIMSQLDELAKRQQQLANNLRNQQQLTEAQRYQQEMLRREAEELQERLEQLQRQQQGQQTQQASNQQGQQGQQSQGGQQGQQGQSGQQGQGQSGQGQAGQSGQQASAGSPGSQQNSEGSQQNNNEQVAQSELQRRMESAIRAMNQASDAMDGNLGPDEMQRAADEALRQLEGARNQIAQDQLANMQQAFSSMSEMANDMVQAQQRMAKQLQDAMAKAVSDRESGEDEDSRGMTLQEEWDLAAEKKALAAELSSLQQQMMKAASSFGSEVPNASDELQRANTALAENELEQAISDAALYIDAGYGLYIAGNESAVTQAMRSLAQSLERAEQMVQNATSQGDSDLDRARQQAQELRAQLQQLAGLGQGQPNQNAQNGQSSGQQSQQGQGQAQQPDPNGQQQGQGNQQAQAGAQQGGQQQGNGGGQRGGFGARGNAWNGTDDFNTGPIQLPDNFYNNVDNFTQLAREAINQLDLNTEELANMYDMIRELEYTRVNRNENILAQEYGEMLALIEQLEVGLQLDSARNNPNNVRSATSTAIPEAYKESVAEYFRRLSRD